MIDRITYVDLRLTPLKQKIIVSLVCPKTATDISKEQSVLLTTTLSTLYALKQHKIIVCEKPTITSVNGKPINKKATDNYYYLSNKGKRIQKCLKELLSPSGGDGK